jgi:pimeloyl-ACP methyl ester carboxylesterase
MRRTPVILVALLGFALLGAVAPVARGQDATPAAASPTTATGDFAGLVDIGGRSLWLECRGAGGPTVVLEAGAGNNGQVWDAIALPPGTASPAVLPGVAAFARVCAYDRPNTYVDPDHPSRSDPVPQPRTAADMVADLHALLTAADVPGPYVLVGHSYGGFLVRLFAMLHPDEVVGLVLVDAAHEDWWVTLDGVLTPAQRGALSAEPAEFPGLERIDTAASADQMRAAFAASPLQPLPLEVLTHGVPWDWPPGFPVGAIEAAWRPLQDDLVALVPDARLVVAERSQHHIQIDQPDLVIEAVRRVVEAARNPSTWATPAASPGAGTPTA